MQLRPFCFLFAAAFLGSAPPSPAARLECDPAESRIEIIVKATVDSFTGRLEKFDPEITVEPVGRITGARVRFNFGDVKTGKDKRDRAMHEWQQTPDFPTGEFVLEGLSPEANGQSRARGRLQFHGRSLPLEFPVTVVSQGDICAIDGEAVVDTREFGLPIIRMMGLLKVDPLVRVRFHLQGKTGVTP